MLNNKVGNFKFIYVAVLLDKEEDGEDKKEEEEEALKIRPQRLSRKPRPKTLLELLERLHLEVNISTSAPTTGHLVQSSQIHPVYKRNQI